MQTPRIDEKGGYTVGGFPKQAKTPAQKLSDQIQQSVFDSDGIVDHFLRNQHAQYQHRGNREETVNRLLTWPDKRANSVFLPERHGDDPMKNVIEQILLDNADSIAEWVLYGEEKEKAFHINPDDTLIKIGYGVKRMIDPETGQPKFMEMACYDAIMILVKDDKGPVYRFGTMDIGIGMKTVYPDTMSQTSVPTGRDLVPDVLASLAFSRSKSLAEKQKWLQMAGTKDPSALLKAEQKIPRPVPGHAKPRDKTDYTTRLLAEAEEIKAKHTRAQAKPDFS